MTISTTQNCSAKRGVILVGRAIESGMKLFYESLADAVDEIGVGRSETGGPHGRRHLSAMIGGVGDHVRQNVVACGCSRFRPGCCDN